jgi:hypothetical protein
MADVMADKSPNAVDQTPQCTDNGTPEPSSFLASQNDDSPYPDEESRPSTALGERAMADVMADKSPNAVDQTPQCSTLVDELILVKATYMVLVAEPGHSFGFYQYQFINESAALGCLIDSIWRFDRERSSRRPWSRIGGRRIGIAK